MGNDVRFSFNLDTAADSQLVSLQQVSQILQRSRASLYRDNQNGVLPFVRIGNSTRVKVASLRKLIAGG